MNIRQQIMEVERELEFRSHVYPRMVSTGKMKRSDMLFRTQAMQAVKRTLEWLRDNEAKIKERVG